jgi:hypothetical protein
MTIGRRQVVGLGVLGIGATALDGCGALPWGHTPSMDSGEAERLFSQLDHVLGKLQALEPDTRRFGIKPDNEFVPAGEATVKRLLTALCFLGTYRDIPDPLKKDPRIEARVMDAAMHVGPTVDMALRYLVQLPDDEMARIDAKLQKDERLTMRIMERVDDYAKQIDVPLEQRTYLRTATLQLAGRYRNEGIQEITAKLASKFQRTVDAKLNELGIPGDADSSGDAADAGAPPNVLPIRAQFRTHATPNDVHIATCALAPRVTLEGNERQVVLDWEEFRCPVTLRLDGEQPIHGAVHTVVDGDQNVVTVVLFPPPGAQDEEVLKAAVTSLAKELRSRLPTVRPMDQPVESPFAGQTCATSADCGPLHCIDGVCRDPFASKNLPAPRRTSVRLGVAGESCLSQSDCESPLVCTASVCKSEADLTTSERLARSTKVLAKYGAYLSIPPICAIGVLVLLSCLFMVIVAGCLYAGGD